MLADLKKSGLGHAGNKDCSLSSFIISIAGKTWQARVDFA
jgi:hypothetical protein